ncbi:MAG: hypothetical protein AAF658_01320 [Myxococcota bacterium]
MKPSHSVVALLVAGGLAACADPPPDVVELGAVEVSGTSSNVVVNRGIITTVSPAEDSTTVQLEPGLFFLWEDPDLPTPRDLVALLSLGFTSLILPDRPIVESLAIRDYVGTARGRGPRVYISGPELGQGLPRDDERAHALRLTDLGALNVDFVVIRAERGAERVCAAVDGAKRQGVLSWVRLAEGNSIDFLERCPPTVVWLDESTSPPTAEGNVVWLSTEPDTSEHSALPIHSSADGFPTASKHITRHTVQVAHALGIGDAVGRIAPGFVADLVLLGPTNRATDVYIEGVRQAPALPWLADWRLGYGAWLRRLKVPDSLDR